MKLLLFIDNIMYNPYYYKLLTEVFGYTIEQEKIVNGNTPVLKQLLKNHQFNINDLLLFIENIPVYTPIKKQNIAYLHHCCNIVKH